MHTLLENTKIARGANAAAAGQTDVATGVFDMAGYDGIMFVALVGDAGNGAVLTLTAQENSANQAAGMAALTGTATFTADATSGDNKALVLDLVRPAKRYVRAVLSRGAADTAVDGILAIQYRARSAPTVQDASVVATKIDVTPAES